MRDRQQNRLRWGCFAALFCLFAAGPGGAGARGAEISVVERDLLLSSDRVDPRVVEALERQHRVRVLVRLALPPQAHARQGARWRDRASERQAIAETGDELLGSFGRGEFELRHRFRSVAVLAGRTGLQGLLRLARHPRVLQVDLDQSAGGGGLVQAVPQVALDVVHGHYTGRGVTVAVIDSGIRVDHPDLADDLAGEHCFCTGCCPGGGDEAHGPGAAADDHGHGTAVSGVVTSAGRMAPVGGAPDAEVVAIKVLDANNTFCCLSDLMASLDHVLNDEPDVELVNLSLGTFELFEGDCDDDPLVGAPLAQLIDQLRSEGVLTFAASMNDGSSTAMAAPACVSSAISVGAVYDADVGGVSTPACSDRSTQRDKVACWSNSNASTDLVAPGANITSTGLWDNIATFRGTSQAAPLALACAATLLEAEPSLTPDAIEAALEASAVWVTDPKNGLRFPRLDCEAAHLHAIASACSNGVDDDGDGKVDSDDPGCTSSLDPWEGSAAHPCDNGVDDDGDGATDYPDDIGCADPSGIEAPRCADGVDNDGDGRIDWDGAGIGEPDSYCREPSQDEEARPLRACGLGAELVGVFWVLRALRRRRTARRPPGRQLGGPRSPAA